MSAPIHGVWLTTTFDGEALYGQAIRDIAPDVILMRPDEVSDPKAVRFALCWQPHDDAFAPYPNLTLAMTLGAGVDSVIAHPGLTADMQIARMRDTHQADQMAGFVAHEVLHRERHFDELMRNAKAQHWQQPAMRAPNAAQVAVLGHGTMGRAVVRALSVLGFSLRVACRTAPADPLPGVSYCVGDGAVQAAATGADYLVNVLPLTPQTESVLNGALFARLRPGAWLVQIGRGEHLAEADLVPALDAGHLAGATLDVFRTEPLPTGHAFWRDPRLRITPHVASISQPEEIAQQAVETARALRDGAPIRLAIDRNRGY